MGYIGALAVIVGVYIIWREYSAFLDRELRLCRAFVRAVSDYKEKVRCYMDSPKDWAEGYTDDTLSELGFLLNLRDGADFKEAYGAMRGNLHITDELNEILTSCFDRLGDGYLDTELETLDTAVVKLRSEEDRISLNLSKRWKAAGAMLGAFALGTVILVI